LLANIFIFFTADFKKSSKMDKEIDIRIGRYHGKFEGTIHLEHYENEMWFGQISCFPNMLGSGYEIGVITTSKPGGVGRELIRGVVEMIGEDQAIEMHNVIEMKTAQTLLELGFYDKVKSIKEKVVITETEVLKELKMVRVLQGGGVKVHSVSLEYIEDWYFPKEYERFNHVHISIFGKT
jgi:hypothetical protein